MRRSLLILLFALLGVSPALARQGADAQTKARAAKAEGDKFYADKKLKEALADYSKATTLDPKFLEAWDALGNLYFEQGSYDHAVEAYQKGVAVDPSYVLGLYNIAFCYSAMGKFPKAAE